MCGIAAIFAYHSDAPPVNTSALERIQNSMITRGPDGGGRWVAGDGRVGLAHRRLSIIDLSDAAAQPMTSSDGRYVISYNGEIYNYRELRRELVDQGVKFQSESDTEVIIELYRRDGAKVVESLRGMFGFAIWDNREQGMFLARDPYGIKPVYMADDGRCLRVASQVKALLAGGDIDVAPDPAGHVGYFLFGAVPEPATLYRGIKALPAGHTMWIDSSGPRKANAYFDIGAELRRGEAEALDLGPMKDGELRDALVDSISHHLVADVPVGVFLSAGLDSATLAALAAATSTTQLKTLTLGFDEYAGTEDDEAPLAAQVAAQIGADHQTARIDSRSFADEYDRFLAAMDQPSTDGINTYFVAKAASDAGLKVALSGVGGDELFGGYSTFADVPRLVRALAPLRHAPVLGRAFRVVSAPMIKHVTSPKYAGLLEYGTCHGDAYLLRRALYMPWELPDVLDPDLARAGWAEIAPRIRMADRVEDGTPVSSRARISTLESAWYMRNQLLRDADWAGMAHSLEIRTPLVDAALLRRLAPWIAGSHPPGKQDMAATPGTPLPAAVLNRAKTGFAVPIRSWLAEKSGQDTGERGIRNWARTVYRAQWAD
ncbi:MAG: asparagine synthase (glutamine-hydrolyzing) [Rhodospirillales bacterium]|nr:asparagine synthase (glutamine-hydrolyzing) [Rhodospirillales bacterium]